MRYIIVSNRLPLRGKPGSNGAIEFTPSIGGLSTGLSSYIKSGNITEYLWIGWPGIDIEEHERQNVTDKLLEDFKCVPVFLDRNLEKYYYNGFCNQTLWPLFHIDPANTKIKAKCWEYYKKANDLFCDKVMEVFKEGDIIWIHDFHLLMLPQLIRNKLPNATIGFFQHIPFPCFDIFKILMTTWRSELLQGILGADFIGFHINDYVNNFEQVIARVLRINSDGGLINHQNRLIKYEALPMNIDFKGFSTMASSLTVQRKAEQMRSQFYGQKIILSIDRLDYTKGIINKLKGYRNFLKENPQQHKKVVLLLIAAPSMRKVKAFDKVKKQVDRLVAEINNSFRTDVWFPVFYDHKALSVEEMVTIYTVADVALVTPLRDGMNLIAKEYLASRNDQSGVLILSETAGASIELSGAHIVNPFSIDDIAESLKIALEVDPFTQMLKNKSMRSRLSRYNISSWAEDNIKILLKVREDNIVKRLIIN